LNHEKSGKICSIKAQRGARFRLPRAATAALVAGSALLCGGHICKAQEYAAYNIGVLSDLNGPIASISRPSTAGLRAYIAATNAKGGVNGRKISLQVRDTKSDSQAARTQFNALVAGGVVAIVGPDLSTNYIAVAPLAATAKVPLLSQGAPNDLVAQAKPYYYLTTIPLPFEAKIAVDYIQTQRRTTGGAAPKIAALYTNSASTATWREGLIQDVKTAFGSELTDAEQLDSTAINVTSPVSKIVATNPDYVLLRILGTQVPLVVSALRDKGFAGQIIADYNGGDTAVLKSVNDPGYLVIRPFADPVDMGDPGVQKMLDDAKTAGLEAEATSAFFTYGYVSGSVIVQALKECTTPCDGEAFDKAISALKPEAMPGLSGPLGYQNGDHRLVHYARFYIWDGTKSAAVPGTDWINGAN
jgi:branched-chain amino acid transport system substrate-binding protein